MGVQPWRTDVVAKIKWTPEIKTNTHVQAPNREKIVKNETRFVQHAVVTFTFFVTGDHDLNATDGYEQNVPIEKIFRHPQYTSNLRRGTTDYDVALVKLQSPLTYNNRVRPVCLPQVSFSANTNCYVTGWDTFSEEGSFPQVIKIKKRI